MRATRDRPMYSKWRRKAGGWKTCPRCRRKHKSVEWDAAAGRAIRPKVCLACGADLPEKLTYPRKGEKGRVRWYVREFNPVTGRTRDIPVESSEHADETIARLRRDYTPDPTVAKLIEHASTLCRQIESPGSLDEAVNALIERLGGDPTRRTLKPIGWDEAVSIVIDEMTQKGKAESYCDDVRLVAADLKAITGLDDWSALTLEHVAKYRSVRMAGGWQRNARTVKPVGGRAINKALATLSAFLNRAVRKGWVARNVLEGAPDERVKVPRVRVDYMPDVDLAALIEAAGETWMGALIVLAYYTGARRGDLLRLEWERDVDLDGLKAAAEGRSGPHLFVRGQKADTPHWAPLHPAAVQALRRLRKAPVVDPRVFPVRGSTNPGARVSHQFADLAVKAGLVEEVEHDGKTLVKNKWSLHDLRRKANTDLRNRGASPKERQALLGHRTAAVNEAHYEAVLPDRERALIDGLPTFGMTA